MNLLSGRPECWRERLPGDTRYLRSLPGVGAKLAGERMVLELADESLSSLLSARLSGWKLPPALSQIDLDALAEGLSTEAGYSRRDTLNTLANLLNENPPPTKPP